MKLLKMTSLTKKLSRLIIISFVLIFFISSGIISVSYYTYFENMMADKLSQSTYVASHSNVQSFFWTIRREALNITQEEPVKSFLEGKTDAANIKDFLIKCTDISVSVFMEVHCGVTGEAVSFNEYGHVFQIGNPNSDVDFTEKDMVVLPVTVPRNEGERLPRDYTVIYQKVSEDGSYIATGLSSNIIQSGILSSFIPPQNSIDEQKDGFPDKDDSNFYLVNADGMILADYFSALKGQSFDSFTGSDELAQSKFDEDHTLFNYNRPSCLVSCSNQELVDMYIVGVIQKQDIFHAIVPTLLMIYLMIFVLLSIFCVLCLLVLHRAFFPYDKLVKKVSERSKSKLVGAELLEEAIDKGIVAEKKTFKMVLNDYIHDREIDLDTLSVIEQRYPGSYTPILCKVDDIDCTTSDTIQQCHKVLENALKFLGEVLCIQIDKNKLLFLLCGRHEKLDLFDVLQKNQQLLTDTGISTSYIVGDTQSRLKNINNSYYAMRKVMFMWVCYGRKSIVTHIGEEEHVDIPSNTISNLIGSINAGEKEKIESILGQTFDSFQGKRDPLISIFLLQLTLSIISHIASFDSKQNLFDYQELINRITEAPDLDAAKQWISHLCFDACNYLVTFQNKAKGKQDVEIKILEYLNKNYSNPNLSLIYLSDLFGYSPKYLGRIFKNYTNQFFTQYLTEVRMEKARELILNTDRSISDIYGMVGITSSQYFYRLFKKQYGYSPASLRKHNHL
ncbi:helix-turn-helix domain-containing protein [Massilioclostridium coli]|uniref:helix-turn-helix domain-containing protein n=1 Tax=Massilioclostridium coli TaxID=1870991 RepID=UPI0022E08C0C|nr:helix-turn-helix domain-containing protein [Massilioclostridium coli]